ncbi:hypothetical protein KR200_001504 [Drosophila serrata]|nr:hypothetical protein KR200_001504 [Drosophila serrata]
MCSKRSLSVLADTEDEQENPPKNTSKSLCQHTSTEFTGSPKANNVLGDSLSIQRRNKISKFEESWLALNKSCMGQSLMDASMDTSWTSSLSTKARTKALPISTYQSSPRTPPAISRSNKSPQILSSSFKTSRLWSKLIGEESSQTISYNSPKTSPLIEKSNEIPRRLSSSLKTSQRWNDLMSDHSLNESSCTDDSHVESSPVIRLVPDQPSQYLPSSSQKRVIPKSHIRAVKGGYADSFQRLLKSVRMDQRHLSSREPTHSGHVLAITEEFNVTMALVETESQQCSPSSSFNIILQSKQSKNVKVGFKVQFYLNPKIKPLELTNKQLVYCQPHNVIVL